MFGRTIKCCIANDNGRATEFIRRKNYPDKSTCYECGVSVSEYANQSSIISRLEFCDVTILSSKSKLSNALVNVSLIMVEVY